MTAHTRSRSSRRLGWLVAPQRHVRDIEKLAQNLYISPATPSQRAALACFDKATADIVEARREAFQARRDFLVPALRDMGFGVPVMPTGGFFVYADGLGPGLAVTKGDAIGHVEMLGVRHDVRAPRGGTVRHLVAESGEAVEYGQVVVEIEPAGGDGR